MATTLPMAAVRCVPLPIHVVTYIADCLAPRCLPATSEALPSYVSDWSCGLTLLALQQDDRLVGVPFPGYHSISPLLMRNFTGPPWSSLYSHGLLRRPSKGALHPPLPTSPSACLVSLLSVPSPSTQRLISHAVLSLLVVSTTLDGRLAEKHGELTSLPQKGYMPLFLPPPPSVAGAGSGTEAAPPVPPS